MGGTRSLSPVEEAEPARKSRKTRWSQLASTAKDDIIDYDKEDNSHSSKDKRATSAPETPADAAAVAAASVAAARAKESAGSISSAADKSAATKAALEKARKALALQKQIQDQIAAIKSGFISGSRGSNAIITAGVAAALRAMPQTKPIRFDRLGRELDAEGKVIEVKPLGRSTLKVNINKEREAKLKQVVYQTKVDRTLTNPSANPWFDPALPTTSKVRRKGLSFVERGFYSKKEKAMHAREQAAQLGVTILTPAAKAEHRRKAAASDAVLRRIMRMFKTEEDEEKDEDKSEEADDASNPNFVKLGSPSERKTSPPSSDTEGAADDKEEWVVYRQEALHLLQRKQVGLIPDVEWWDQPLLKKIGPEDDVELDDPEFPYIIIESVITNLVEHPVPLAPVVDGTKPIPPVLHLTPKERAKLRRRKRQEKEKDKRDKFRMAPPPPKVKLANLSRVLGIAAAADPSKVEAEVKGQIAERLRLHEGRNAARKLDPDHRRKRTINKWTKLPSEAEVPTGGAEVCVFSIFDLSDPACLFKVDRNAQQFHITGGVLLCPPIGNLVIAEGSHKALKGYKKLLLRRVKWTMGNATEDAIGGNNIEAKVGPTFCRLLWEGIVKDRAFKQWKVYVCKSESEIYLPGTLLGDAQENDVLYTCRRRVKDIEAKCMFVW